MQTVGDLVMGGKSHSTCPREQNCLLWEGTLRKVDFLNNEPGFCNLRTKGSPNLSVLQSTQGIAFYARSSSSSLFHLM